MMRDRYAVRPATPVGPLRCKTGYACRIILAFILSLFLTSAWAQSNVTFPLRIGATGDVALLEDFPESYAGVAVWRGRRLSRRLGVA